MNNSTIFRKIKIHSDYMKRVVEFAEKVAPTNNYEDRNQYDIKTKISQNVMGKLGEKVIYDVLSPFLVNLTEPDLTVYEKKDKSWSPDLVSGDIRILCKTCYYGSQSWIFNKRDKKGYGRDSEFYDHPEGKILVVAKMMTNGIYGQICGMIPVTLVHSYEMLGKPNKPELVGIKEAIYEMSLQLKDGGFVNKIHPSVLEMLDGVLV
jgi:hypothetical protein